MQAFRELFERLGFKRAIKRRSFALGAELHDALVERAGIERREADNLIAELVSTGLKRIENEDWLSVNWERLSRREQQMAKEMWVSPHTVKEYLRSTQVKWKVHSKSELRLLHWRPYQ
jgi:hypothetical protein